MLTHTIALTAPLKQTVWETQLSFLFMVCFALDLNCFQLFITATNTDHLHVPPTELQMDNWQCPMAPQISKTIKSKLHEGHRLCQSYWNSDGFASFTQRHHHLKIDAVRLPDCPSAHKHVEPRKDHNLAFVENMARSGRTECVR
jgi:hypothetical protein